MAMAIDLERSIANSITKMRREEKLSALEAQQQFINAAVNLSDAWMDELDELYPFSESFEEVIARMFKWRAATCRMLSDAAASEEGADHDV